MEDSFIQNIIRLVEPLIPKEIEIGIINRNKIAIAGSCSYSKKVGTERKSPLIPIVLNNKKPIFIENKYNSRICRGCTLFTECPYASTYYFPIIVNTNIFGIAVILIRKNVITDINKYRNIFEEIGITINNFYNYYHDNIACFKSNAMIDKLLKVMDDKILILDKEGAISNMSESAKYWLIQNNITELNISNYDDVNENDSRLLYNNTMINIFPIKNFGYIVKPEGKLYNKDAVDYIIGNSGNIQYKINMVKEIAKHDSTVLITGETGTGKELFAQAIHDLSSRDNKPMVTVNCGSIPENLLESELFGYIQGAFTGANIKGKKGKFELAHHGTIFLDEIGELPLHLQSKLLRTIETKSIDRLGDSKSVKLDIRIIAATNRDLDDMVNNGTFRKDLYYRLNVVSFELPPLRERIEDINLLIEHFLEKYNNYFKKRLRIDNTVINLFTKYNWPGNIRELSNVIEYCVTLETSDLITIKSLPGWFIKKSLNPKTIDTSKRIKTLEKEAIIQALELFGKNTKGKKDAASHLGICLTSLYYKIKEYNIT